MKKQVAVVDYGLGNLFSIQASLAYLGAEVIITKEPHVLQQATAIVLPGVGAFGDAMKKLQSTELIPVLQEQVNNGKPLLGICLGMQLLFDESEEYGKHLGLGFLSGKVVSLASQLPKGTKIPHMGWNGLNFIHNQKGLKNGDAVYYVHSYHAIEVGDALLATSDYNGVSITGMVQKNNVWGTQFHPEKSGKIGLQILQNFLDWE